MDLVLFGIQGSGKGTQAKHLADEFGYAIFETGKELRGIAASDTELGQTVRSFIDAGKHAPTPIVMEVVHSAIKRIPKDQKLLFDGIPRNMEQMMLFDKIMGIEGRSFKTIELTLPKDIAFQRVLGRAKEQGRADDMNEEAIHERMRLFEEKTRPVIASYKERGNMTEVDGNATPEEVYERLKAAIGV